MAYLQGSLFPEAEVVLLGMGHTVTPCSRFQYEQEELGVHRPKFPRKKGSCRKSGWWELIAGRTTIRQRRERGREAGGGEAGEATRAGTGGFREGRHQTAGLQGSSQSGGCSLYGWSGWLFEVKQV